MLLHNNHWRIVRKNSVYWLEPPRAIDRQQKLIPLRSRTPEIQSIRERVRESVMA
jgi:hypothetical protein